MSDERRRIKEIVQREFHRTRHTREYPVDAITDALIAAGFGDVTKARAEGIEEGMSRLQPGISAAAYERGQRETTEKFRPIVHAVEHLLDDSEERVVDREIVIQMEDYSRLIGALNELSENVPKAISHSLAQQKEPSDAKG